MSTTWRSVFTYVRYTQRQRRSDASTRYNKYSQITARAVRQSMKETERVGAERRGVTALRSQKWENGVGGQQASLLPSVV
jgi:F-type H+-transporting ATPase subunit epsilon